MNSSVLIGTAAAEVEVVSWLADVRACVRRHNEHSKGGYRQGITRYGARTHRLRSSKTAAG